MSVVPAGGPDGSDVGLDVDVLDFVAISDRLAQKVTEAPKGVLGASATGLSGSVHANLTALLRVRSQLDAVIGLAGVAADEAGEDWQGFRPLLRSVAKAAPAEVAAVVRAATHASVYPELGRLWVAGDVSRSQVRRIGDLAAKLPAEHRQDAVAVLAEHAPSLTEPELAQAARALLHAVNPGWDERDTLREEEQSYLSVFPELGGYGVRGHLTIEQGGWLRTVLDAHTSVIPAGDDRSVSQRQADALTLICRTYAESDVIPNLNLARPRFVVMATLRDLLAIASDAAPGDFPMTAWQDRLDPATTRRLLSDAEITPVLVDDDSGPEVGPDAGDRAQTLADVAFEAATAHRLTTAVRLLTKRRKSREFAQRLAPPVFLRLLTAPVVPLALGRDHRIVPPRLRDAVLLRDQHCVVDGCTVPAHRCEIHHVVPWALGGPTDLTNLATLCVRHHRTVENGTWKLRPRTPADGPGHYWIATEKW